MKPLTAAVSKEPTLPVSQNTALVMRKWVCRFMSAGASVDGLLGYSASTRHRDAAYIVTSETAERSAVMKRRPLNDTRPITADDKWANVARALSFQPEKDNAIGMLDRVNYIRRGAVQMFQAVVPSNVTRQISRPEPSLGHEIAATRRLDHSLAQTMEGHALHLRTVVQHGISRVRQMYQRQDEPTITQAMRDAGRARAQVQPDRDVQRRQEQQHRRGQEMSR